MVPHFFNVNVAVSNAWSQNDIGKSVRNIIDRTISNKVRLWRLDKPLDYGVPGGVSSETISHCFNWRPNSQLKYLPLRSYRRNFYFLVTMILHFSLKFFELFKCFRLVSHQVDIPIYAQIICEGQKIMIPATSIKHSSDRIHRYVLFPISQWLAPLFRRTEF